MLKNRQVCNYTIRQGEVYYIDLNTFDLVGSEQGGTRPCVVISKGKANENSNLVIVCPITSKKKKYLPTHYVLLKEKYDFLKYSENIVLTENVLSVSQLRLDRYLGIVKEFDVVNILTKLSKNFGF